MPEKDIIVAGYPKSGNTYLSRLLGDVLNCPVKGFMTAKPLCEEGADRPGLYTIRQLHVKPISEDMNPNFNAWEYSLPSACGEHMALIIRDLPDVIVSVYYYWNMKSKDAAINAVLHGKHPLNMHGSWISFYNRWLDVFDNLPKIGLVRFRDLRENPVAEIIKLLQGMRVSRYDIFRIHEAVDRQEFSKRKRELEDSGNKYNYGAAIQSKNLRGGRVGDYNSELTTEQVNAIRAYFNEKASSKLKEIFNDI